MALLTSAHAGVQINHTRQVVLSNPRPLVRPPTALTFLIKTCFMYRSLYSGPIAISSSQEETINELAVYTRMSILELLHLWQVQDKRLRVIMVSCSSQIRQHLLQNCRHDNQLPVRPAMMKARMIETSVVYMSQSFMWKIGMQHLHVT